MDAQRETSTSTTPTNLAGRYALGEPLGRGRSTVYRATDTRLERRVAVKQVELLAGQEDVDRVRGRALREAQAAARLNNPCVVTVFDVVEEAGSIWLVMELVDAPSLAQVVVDGGPMPHARAARIGLDVLTALEAAHVVGVVHRDVKPANVMVQAGDRAKLTDFGVATIRDDSRLTATGLIVGSPSYMSPEQATGAEVGPPTDLWALGALLYFATEGEPPFQAGSALATASAVVHGERRPAQFVGPLTDIIGGLLTKDPDARPSAGEIRAGLSRVSRGERSRLRTARLPAVAAPPPAPIPVNREAADPTPEIFPPVPAAPMAAAAAVEREQPKPEPEPLASSPPDPERPMAPEPAPAPEPVARAHPESEPPIAPEHEPVAGAAPQPGSPAEAPEPAPAPDAPPTSSELPEPTPAPEAVAGAAPGPGSPAEGREPTFAPETPSTSSEQSEPTPESDGPQPARVAPARAQGAVAATAASAAVGDTRAELRWAQTGTQPAVPAADDAPRRTYRPPERSRSRLVLLVVAAVAVLLVVVAVSALAGGDGDDETSDAGPTATTAAPGGSETATSAPPASDTTATTPAPSTTAPPPAVGAVPAGWTAYSDPSGRYSIAYPAGWSVVQVSGSITDFRDPATGSYLRLDWTDTPGADPAQAWRELAVGFARTHDNYQELGIGPTTYRDYNAAVWEFTYGSGTTVHATNLGFVTGGRGYALLFQTPENIWSSSQGLSQQFRDAFRPVPA
jgi:eukaryotic-like serine/threonine-protein kinase